jgi:hypothetical protein
MGFWTDVKSEYNRLAELQARSIPSEDNSQAVLTESDVDSFLKAADERTKPKSIEQVREILRRKNPVRMARLQSDSRWLRRQMKKMGLNPEDARWLL